MPDLPMRRVSPFENKLRLLLCLHMLAPIKRYELWPFLDRLRLMDYFTYAQLMGELVEDGWAAQGHYALEGMLMPTVAGENALKLFGSRLAQSEEKAIRAAAPAYVLKLGDTRSAKAVYEPSIWQDTTCIRAEMMEDSVPMLSLKLTTRDSALAQTMAERFSAEVPAMLRTLYQLPVIQEFDKETPDITSAEDALNQTIPGKPMLLSYGGKQTAACVCLQGGGNILSMLLLLPDRKAARHWAYAADEAGEVLMNVILSPFFQSRDASALL